MRVLDLSPKPSHPHTPNTSERHTVNNTTCESIWTIKKPNRTIETLICALERGHRGKSGRPTRHQTIDGDVTYIWPNTEKSY